MKKYVLALDLGTTSVRAIVFDKLLNIVDSSQLEINAYYPSSGWVEQDSDEIYEATLQVISMLNVDLNEVISIGITNQRETTVMWNKKTGKQVYNAIVWQSRQSSYICDELNEKGYQELFRNKTGLPIDPYFSATKIKWIFDNVKGVKELASNNELLFGTIDTWIVWKLTNGNVHVTDYSNASRTLLYNIFELKWDQELLDILSIPSQILPSVVDSASNIGITNYDVLGHEIMISSIIGDQQASLFGQTCFKHGDVKTTYGTGCFMLMNTGEKPIISKSGLLTTIAWSIENKVTYALEGTVFVGGSAVSWLKNKLHFISDASETEEHIAHSSNDLQVYVVPTFVGLGTPYWNSNVRGAMYGLTIDTGRDEIIKATIEAIAYQVTDIIKLMETESGYKINKLNVDGGAAKNNYLMQFQANILNAEVEVPNNVEITALGAAYLSGIASGFWQSKDEIIKLKELGTIFNNKISREKREKLYSGWKNAINATITFSDKTVS